MDFGWFRQRKYRHFDRPVGVPFLIRAMNPVYVAGHSFSPLIHYKDEVKRYKPTKHKTVIKPRPIMYASHRDSAVLSYYAEQLVGLLQARYDASGLSECPIAYRALGRANYDFSAEVYKFAVAHSPCTILAFDVTGFFDNILHSRLKARLKELLGVEELPPDWYNVFRAVTKFRFVHLETLKENATLAARFSLSDGSPIASVAELKELKIEFETNGGQLTPPTMVAGRGIPQGTPISAALSNAYMLDFDHAMKGFCDEIGALYRRYSDDILIVCPPDTAAAAIAEVGRQLTFEGLTLSPEKTECTQFDAATPHADHGSAQYLGFMYYPGGAGLRPSSLSRQWRKMRRGVDRAISAASKGTGVLHTKKLRKRFNLIFDQTQGKQLRSFPAYAQRSAEAFGAGEKITRQARRLERAFDRAIADAKKTLPP